ncbi:MAG: TIGR00645 family protein [Pelagibacteraceae bacterium]|nr:TIGR00645 family protein [Pelagibacteraceae bacterium]PHX89671.1 MAG: TIGR00645 family protein [Pelagibacteraceae bacterium]
MIKKIGVIKNIEKKLESSMFASRWFMAPVYVVLSISLAIIMLKVVQEFIHNIPAFVSMDMRNLLLFVLHIIDMALIGNLVLMILFSGYENFVSKIESAKNNTDKPSWMGKIDFSGLKLKLIASIVAISGINLLESFMDLGTQSDRDLKWQIIIHVVFLVSGVLLALMDYIAGKTPNSY